MLLDHRTYTARPGALQKQLALYAKYGFEVQRRHLGDPLAFLVTETGDVNSYVHIWIYKDAADRMSRRNAMKDDPEWAAYLAKSAEAGYLTRQETKLMTPAVFAKGLTLLGG
jgi:hypothetical protein